VLFTDSCDHLRRVAFSGAVEVHRAAIDRDHLSGRRRGARILRADVYERVPVPPSSRAVAQLQALSVPAVLALSSGEALQRILETLPATALAALRRARIVAASERLAGFARECGFDDVVTARGPRPADLLAAAGDART